jgi:hypothetical protein
LKKSLISLTSAALLVTTISPSLSYASSIEPTNEKLTVNKQNHQNVISVQDALEIEQALIQSQINADDYINELTAEGILPTSATSPTAPGNQIITPSSKGSVSVKAISNAIKKHEKSIDSGIKGVINKLPLSKSAKKKLIGVFSVGGLLEVLSHYTGFVDDVEEFLTNVISDYTGLGKTTSNVIAKTITFFLPI